MNQKQTFDAGLLFSLGDSSFKRAPIIVSDDLRPFLLSDSHQSLPLLIESSLPAPRQSAACHVYCKAFRICCEI